MRNLYLLVGSTYEEGFNYSFSGHYFSIGLKSDGTMVIAGDCSPCGVETPDVTGMKGLYVHQIDFK